MAEAGPGGSPVGATPAVQRGAIRRLHRDLQALLTNPNPMLKVRPLPSDMLEWRFVLHDLPADTPYRSACYHGKIVFPPSYPMAPPSLYMLTPNGRLDVNKKLCLSMTDYHPETWNPAWSTETILMGLLSFLTSGERGVGSIMKPRVQREQLAHESWDFNAADATFAEIFPDFLAPPAAASSPSDGTVTTAAATPLAGSEGALPLPPAVSAAPTGRLAKAVPVAAVPTQRGAMDIEFFADAVVNAGGENGGEAPECWICRDDTKTEPLIRPCACRGSMGYVHASCVEAWVAHRRRNTLTGEAPRCSVCHQLYHGQEERPGVRTLARQIFCAICFEILFLLRMFFLILGVCILVVRASDSTYTQLERILFAIVVSLVVLLKLLVLTVSLPVGHPAPTHRFTALFFEADSCKLAHLAVEWYTALAVWTFQWISDFLPWQYLLPVVVCTFVPVFKSMLDWRPSLECLRSCLFSCIFVFLSPLLAACALLNIIFEHPRQSLDPLGPAWHMVVDVASLPLLFFCPSNVPVLTLWGFHGAFMFCGMIERLFVRRFKWTSGSHSWWIAFWLSALISSQSDDFTFGQGWGALPEDRSRIVRVAGQLWVLVFCCFVVSVNWEGIAVCYRTWQNRNGRFTLAAGPSAEGGMGAGWDGRVALAGQAV